MRNFFASRRWYDLLPDQEHLVVTDGYGTPSALGTGSVTTDTYLTAARTSDGTLVIAYMPTTRTISVAMSALSSPAAARWYDPTTGEYITVVGSPFTNTGIRQFMPPGKNHDGDGDWVLVLETEQGLSSIKRDHSSNEVERGEVAASEIFSATWRVAEVTSY